jgi:predicted transcriptional regulator
MIRQEEQQLHRDRYYIVNDILHILYYDPTVKRRSKTGIGIAAGITHRMTVKYLRRLIEQGLLRISYDIGQYGHYELTEKGKRYLQVFDEIEADLRPALYVSERY